MIPGAAKPAPDSTPKQKTYSTLNTLVSPFQKSKDGKKGKRPQAPEKKRMQLDIRSEVCRAFLPENDNSRNGVAVSLGSATLLTTFSAVSAPLLDFGSVNLDDDSDEERENEVVVIVNKYDMGASNMCLQIVQVDDAQKETQIQMLSDVNVKMGMDFLIGQVPKAVMVLPLGSSSVGFTLTLPPPPSPPSIALTLS